MKALQTYILSQKPKVDLLPSPIAPFGSKNYIFNVLKHDIDRLPWQRSLDAASGQLRNAWMFKKGIYCGIDMEYRHLKRGMKRFKSLLTAEDYKRFQLVLGNMDYDIPRLGAFDLCVSTHTLTYVADPYKTIQDFIDALNQNGSLLVVINLDVDSLDRHIGSYAQQFETFEVFFCGNKKLREIKQQHFENTAQEDRARYSMPAEQIMIDTLEEMETENRPELHIQAYIRGLRKLAPTKSVTPLRGQLTQDGIIILDTAAAQPA